MSTQTCIVVALIESDTNSFDYFHSSIYLLTFGSRATRTYVRNKRSTYSREYLRPATSIRNMTTMAQMGTITTVVDNQVNHFLASQVGLTVPQVEFLRAEFRKFGRNPLAASLEILAIENNFDEEKVKNLFELHLTQLRRNDGLPAEKKSIYDN